MEEGGGVEPLTVTSLWYSTPVAGPAPQHLPNYSDK